MIGERPKEWVLWLPLAEWWYNSNWHSSIGVTPFEAVYGQPPALHTPYLAGDSRVEAVRAREQCIQMLKYHLERTQRRMKQQADKHRIDREFEIRDLVYVKLQPYRQHTVVVRTSQKLAAKFFSPFPVTAKIGPVAYRLQLPEHSQIHPLFHVSQLKKHVGSSHVQGILPRLNEEGKIVVVPVAILDRKLGKVGHRAEVYLLVQWSTGGREDATWELYSEVEKRFPHLDLTA